MNIAFKTKQSVELKKHIAMIHSNNGLTLSQRKIANALLFYAYDKMQEDAEHTIHLPLLCRLIGYNSNDHKRIKKDLVTLMSTVIEWNLLDPKDPKNGVDNEIWNASSIIADVRIKGSQCTYSYSIRMRELLYRPEFYGRLNMEIMARFKSAYGLALYENCIRYQNLNQTTRFDLAVFRRLMGVRNDKYTIFRDFKRRVIDAAIKEVNSYSPINISAQYYKVGDQVKALQFIIHNKEMSLVPGASVEQVDQTSTVQVDQKVEQPETLLDRLVKHYCFTTTKAGDLLKQYGEAYIEDKIKIMLASSAYQNGRIKSISAYLLKALTDDFKPAKSSKQDAKELIVARQKKDSEDKIKAQRYAAYISNYLNKEIMAHYSALSEKQKNEITQQFSQTIRNNVYENILSKNGVEYPIIAIRFCDYIREQRKDWLTKFKSFEEYLTVQEHG